MTRRTLGFWLLALVLGTLVLRTVALDRVPPHLYYDEAGQGLDAREVFHGAVRGFFSRSMGKEPLYIYMSVPFVAAADTEPIAVRVAAAILGALTVAALFYLARALWSESPAQGAWIGLLAGAFWAVNYWPHSINRLGFRVNTLPLLLTLAMTAWVLWLRRPSRGRAWTFGLLAGGTLLTYLAARVTLVLWGGLLLLLTPSQRRRLWPSVPWAVAAFLLGAGPMLVHFLFHPADAVSRVMTFPVWHDVRQTSSVLAFFGRSAWAVLGGFLGWAGDPIPRHNLPGRPPFAPVFAVLFVVGLVLALRDAVRGPEPARYRARALLLWWGVMLVPAILAAADNPHFLRLFGAVPPALVLAAWPLGLLGTRVAPRGRTVLVALVVLWLGVEGARTGYTYFVTWAQQTDLYTWFQADIWTIGERVQATPGAIGIVPHNPFYGDTYREYVLDYVFRDAPILQMRVLEDRVEDWLAQNLREAGGRRVMVTVWHAGEHVNADPKDILGFYLTREGRLERRETFRGFELVTYRLAPRPQFRVRGRPVPIGQAFQQGVRLLEARWGVAYPNPQRDRAALRAGTAVWAILTWQLERPLPDLKVTLDVVDGQGHRVATDERYLLDADRWPTSRWQPGTIARSYHLVTIPPTQAPGVVFLASRVYEAESLRPLLPQPATGRGSVRWAAARVLPAIQYPRPEAVALERRLDRPVAPDLTLLGVAVWPRQVAPGQTVTLRLYWYAPVGRTRPFTATVRLAEGAPLAWVRVPAPLPAGALIHTDVDVTVPPETSSGRHPLVLQTPAGSLRLGPWEVSGRARRFTAPPIRYPATATFGPGIRFLGVADIRREGETLRLQLVWQVSAADPRALKRFVHLLGPDRRPLTQEDAVPCRGACPASSWLPGEILVDEARLPLPEGLARGPVRLGIGWYRADTLQRLPAWDADGNPLPDNLLVISVPVP